MYLEGIKRERVWFSFNFLVWLQYHKCTERKYITDALKENRGSVQALMC